MTEFKRNLITAALPYANGPVHLGHVAGNFLPADIFARYLRLKGEDVKFIGGTDEHGVPITIKARNENTTPKAVVDKYHELIKKSLEDLGISFDIFSRTSNEIHHKTAQEFFLKLYQENIFTELETEQYFDETANQFLADRYITGACPRCGNENAYGDQCEKCGSTLNPTDLINPRSMLSGGKPVMRKTKNWFLPLDKLQTRLDAYISSHPEWKSNVLGQCKSWLNHGLQPRAMTRDLDWGVKVPLTGIEGKVLYVWFDAPIGYISATKELLPNDWEKYWKNPDSRIVHFLGKDNIVFHCIIFPAMLMAHGEYILPDNVPANEFLNLEGEKFSTSRNWAVWLHEYLEDFKDKQDVLRYVLCATAPETKDNDFTWKDFQARNNNELVAILGNFINRTLVLIHKYYSGIIPLRGELQAIDEKLLEEAIGATDQISGSLDQFRFREALSALMDLARKGNKYLAETEPWKIQEKDPARVKTILSISIDVSARLQILMKPFMPFTSEKLRRMLGILDHSWSILKNEILMIPGHPVNEPSLLFEKIEDATIEAQIARLHASKKDTAEIKEAAPIKPLVTFEEFSKMDIRTGTIIEAEKVPKADKLLKLLVDIGHEKRTVVSGIASFYKAEEIIGRKVSILINLQPRKLRGIDSHGMILMAEDGNGALKFVSAEECEENGAMIK